ncbi:multisubunit potassium/proton antiporter, PhaE subunit [Loktanella fryxellensis]|uniref:Multisubunit potassium/proton antiporter, PhaE subunit n=1 Tax=Loktanella fryxellensis TaxID=245187 RepID=A0A1H8EDP8_9RHOB|nr:Na+/H+ antiporter subunit E [Loktanella fryxellensis]SEN17649.1 multisubunit potassium/proton antiporter, PhaE subunit [Loktanella fryxellensis]
MMQRILPHPLLTVMLTIVWCLINNEFAPGPILLGLIIGLIVPVLTAAWWPDRPPVVRPLRMIAYLLIVIYDIIGNNLTVAMQVLFYRKDSLRPAWIVIPLDLKRPEAITILAGTITLTPGTLTVDLAQDGCTLLVHALHAPDPDAVRDDIKMRYERRLKEIFA